VDFNLLYYNKHVSLMGPANSECSDVLARDEDLANLYTAAMAGRGAANDNARVMPPSIPSNGSAAR